jgi:hypothetical protein
MNDGTITIINIINNMLVIMKIIVLTSYRDG